MADQRPDRGLHLHSLGLPADNNSPYMEIQDGFHDVHGYVSYVHIWGSTREFLMSGWVTDISRYGHIIYGDQDKLTTCLVWCLLWRIANL